MMGFKAIFKKQIKVFAKSPEVLIQFAIFPFLAYIITVLIDFEAMAAGMEALDGMTEELGNMIQEMMAGTMPNMVTMQAVLFAGMALIPTVAGFISEDIEKKRLRFLMMAGVRPAPYLLGVGSVVAIVAFVSTVAFALVGEFGGVDFWIFTGAMMSGVAGSIMLGATIGILTKNQQTSTALAMPAALVFGFLPMMAQFSDSLARWLQPLYTQQLNVIADRLNGLPVDMELWQSFAIMWANVIVLGVLFTVVYRAKGIKD